MFLVSVKVQKLKTNGLAQSSVESAFIGFFVFCAKYRMGVPKFRSLLPNHALKNTEVTSVPHIRNAYFDMNNLYWRVIRTRGAGVAFLAKTQARINEIYHRFRPSNLVYFAIDGPSPIAKIHLQRGNNSLFKSNSQLRKVEESLRIIANSKSIHYNLVLELNLWND